MGNTDAALVSSLRKLYRRPPDMRGCTRTNSDTTTDTMNNYPTSSCGVTDEEITRRN